MLSSCRSSFLKLGSSSWTSTAIQQFPPLLSLALLSSNNGRGLSSSSSSASPIANAKDEASLVTWEVDASTHIGTLTLCGAPKTFNALTVEMGHAFAQRVREIQHDLTTGRQDVRAIVLQGLGDDAFSAGGNREWLQSLGQNTVQENADHMLNFYKSFLCVRTLPVPVIAALHGPAIGAGAGLALACDMRTAAPKAKILGINFARLGIHCGMGSSHFLEHALGGRAAVLNEILLLGKTLSGQECYDLQLINRLDDNAKDAAYEIANEIATQQHPVAVRSMLQTVRARQDAGLELALQRESLVQATCYNRQDWGEGVKAVFERRSPVFDPYHSK